jgi:hypothetical protein
MAEEKLTQAQMDLQEKLLAEFFDTRYFGDQHDFAARAEILNLRARVAELEGKPNGKAEKGSGAATKARKSEG